MISTSTSTRYDTIETAESAAGLCGLSFAHLSTTYRSCETQVSTTSPIHTGTVRELEDQPWLYHCHCVPDEFDPFPLQHTTAVPGQ